ncbi:MAG: prepilin-type N-terminal cleavage/methylation domain-containing protein [Candidatus Omnitrophica bacterium]|nr:prepilin-type N-terminal cleavage/methylation domain-containing protein [Candidatus Omnitrophota bacterium]
MDDNHKMLKRTNFLSGFSLVEIVVVVAIIALVSVTVGVSLSTLAPRELENEVQKLTGDLAWAKSMSISTHFHYKVDFDINSDNAITFADNVTYIIYTIDPDDLTVPPVETVVKRRILSVDRITLIPGLGGPVTLLNLSFMTPQGNLNTTISDPVTIQLQKGSAVANVTIRNLTGHISWERL